MDELELSKRILQWEDSTQEFKSKKVLLNPKTKSRGELDVAAEIVAFSNKNGGTLFIGVEDDATIEGLLPDELELVSRAISSLVRDKVNPPIIIDSTNIVTNDLGVVIAIKIPKGIDKPYQTTQDGRFYIRSGHEKTAIKHREELRRLFQEGEHVYAEKKTLESATLDLINFELFSECHQARHQESLPDTDEEKIDIMRKGNFIIDDRLTTVGILNFTDKPQILLPSFFVSCICFDGTDLETSDFKEERRYEGTLKSMYEESYAFLDKWNINKQVEGTSFNSNGKRLIPPKVIEEILINALIHRDYFIQAQIRVFVFDDRVEIISPGSLPNSQTLFEAKESVPRLRNPITSRVAADLLNYKGIGTGLRRAIKLHPQISFDNDTTRQSFRVVIPYTH